MADNNAAEGHVSLAMEHITKIYGNGFIANKDVTFSVRRGEIHGLVGENGAGKTTLMKVLFGQELPEEGRILLDGKEVRISNPLEALSLGIGMVHQHFMLVNELTVAENMVLSAIPRKHGIRFDLAKARQLTDEVAKKYNLPIDSGAVVGDLSVSAKQRVEILKILLREARILLFDEPTAVLTPQETRELFAQLKKLREQGFTIVFISHKLNEIKEICDRITVLRRGRVVSTCDVDKVSIQEISNMMVGRDVSLRMDKRPARPGKTVLRVEDVGCVNGSGKAALEHVSFSVREGEVLGIAGVEGNGQGELSDMLMGLLPVQSGRVTVGGRSLAGATVNEIRGMGVSLVHEDRMSFGTSTEQAIHENLTSDRISRKPFSAMGVIDKGYVKKWSQERIEEFGIKCDGYVAPVQTLSGGNIQKVVVAREFSSKPKLLIASQPTRGIDVGATELIRRKIIELRDEQHTAVLLFSADLGELLTVSDRLIVMFEGHVVAYFPSLEEVTEETLGEYMLGLKCHSPEQIGGATVEEAD